jgi:site-specific DNA-methyltransferase (cytosine-N4-specific)
MQNANKNASSGVALARGLTIRPRVLAGLIDLGEIWAASGRQRRRACIKLGERYVRLLAEDPDALRLIRELQEQLWEIVPKLRPNRESFLNACRQLYRGTLDGSLKRLDQWATDNNIKTKHTVDPWLTKERYALWNKREGKTASGGATRQSDIETKPMPPDNARTMTGDWLAEMRKLPANSVNNVLSSPPYFGMRDFGHPGQMGLEPTLSEHLQNYWWMAREAWRVARRDATIMLVIDDRRSRGPKPSRQRGSPEWGSASAPEPYPDDIPKGNWLRIPDHVIGIFVDAGWQFVEEITLYKQRAAPSLNRKYTTHVKEVLLVFAKSENYYRNRAFRKPALNRRHQGPWERNRDIDVSDCVDAGIKDVWETLSVQGSAHPAPMALAVARTALRMWGKPGGVVLDMFSGSGTTGVAALELGMNVILIEISEKFMAQAIERMAAMTIQEWKPPFITPKGSSYHANADDGLRKTPSGAVAIVIVDPPQDATATLNGYLSIFWLWDEILRVTRLDSPILIACNARLLVSLVGARSSLFQYLIPWQPASDGRATEPMQYIAVFSRVPLKITLPLDPLWPAFEPGEKVGFPRPKPIALIEWLILYFSRENDIVLDFVSGRGTTAIAAIRTGRRFLCIESDVGAFEIGCNRIQRELSGGEAAAGG